MNWSPSIVAIAWVAIWHNMRSTHSFGDEKIESEWMRHQKRRGLFPPSKNSSLLSALSLLECCTLHETTSGFSTSEWLFWWSDSLSVSIVLGQATPFSLDILRQVISKTTLVQYSKTQLCSTYHFCKKLSGAFSPENPRSEEYPE